MKRFIMLLAVIMLMCPAFSQVTSPQDRRLSPQELERLAAKSAIEFANRKAEAERMAVQNGWTVRKEFPDGRVVEIMELGPNGMPEYNTTNNLNAAYTTGTNELWSGGSTGLNLTGAGFTIGEWDGGGVRTSHQEFVPSSGPTRVTQKDSPPSTSYHSTHVAGTLIAEGQVAAAHGMAPSANLHAYDWNNDISEMLNANVADGIVLSNHSYGRVRGWDQDGVWFWFGDTTISRTEDYQFGFYGQLTKTWDSTAYAMQDFLFVKSAGNDRGDAHAGGHYVWDETLGAWVYSSWPRQTDGGTDGYDCIENRGCAKNLLTVGAVNDIPGGYTGPGDVVMTTFSAWGPTDDGRIKPDIVANGMNLYSCDDDADNDYTTLPGTSMASPNVCGTLALLQDYHQEVMGSYMYADELKALVINTAFEAGPNNGPDYKFGWGLMNAIGAAELITLDDLEGGHIGSTTLNNGETDEFIYYSDGSEPINVTMVWIDPPHSALTPSLNPTTYHLVNDLDVRVIRMSTSTTYYPWRLNPASPGSAATAQDNYRDNVEKVTIASPAAGHYKITVTHKGALASAQWYALVVSGMHRGVPGRWIGVTSTNWNTQSNWDDYVVPTSTVNVTIPAGCTYYPVLSGDLGISYTTGTTYLCDNLTVESGGTITINTYSLHCAGNINLDGAIIVGNDITLYNGAVLDLSGLLNSGYTTGYYGVFTANSGATINQTGGTLYTEEINLVSGCQYNGTGGYCRIYQEGSVPTPQTIQVDDADSYFRYFTIESGVTSQMYDCSADLDCWSLNIYGSFDLNGYNVTADYSDVYGILTIPSGVFDITLNGPYFHTISVLNMSGGQLNGNESIRFFSGATENVTGGTITLLQDFYNEYGVFTPSGGDFFFEGAGPSNIIGGTSFYNLYVDKTYTGIDALENGTGNGLGVDITVENLLYIMDGSLELNSPCTLSVGYYIIIGSGAVLNANDNPDVYIQDEGSWSNDNLSGGFLSGSYSIVEFNAPPGSPGIQIVGENNLFNDVIINSGAPYVRPSINVGYGLIHARNMDVISGSLKLAGEKVIVDEVMNVYGNVRMDETADSLLVNDIFWKSGSTDNISTGKILVSGSWTWEAGTNASISSGNLVRFIGNTNEYIYSYDPDAAFYNMEIEKGSYPLLIHLASTQPVHVLNNVNVFPGSIFQVLTKDLEVEGTLDVQSGGTMRLTDGGSVDLDGDFTLNGYVHLNFGGDFYVHGDFEEATTGNINIEGGSFVVDQPFYAARAIQWLRGILSMSGGIFEITHNHLEMSSTFVDNITGGVIRAGGSFIAVSDVFQPSGGTVELINYSGGGSPYIDLNTGNYMHNLVVSGNVTWLLGGSGASQLTIMQDLTISSGGLNGSDDIIYIGDDWTNNVGAAGFFHGTGTVYLNGINPSPDRQMISGTNDFYNLTNLNVNSVVEFAGPTTVSNIYNASAGGADCETFITGSPVNIDNQLILTTGAFALSTSAPSVYVNSLDQGGAVQVTDGYLEINDIVEAALYGSYTLADGTIDITQVGSSFMDLNADIDISGGQMNLYGGADSSWWPSSGTHVFEMSAGVIQFHDIDIYLYSNNMTYNITGGKIKTVGNFICNDDVSVFDPSGGEVELYGTSPVIVNMGTGSWFHDLTFNKTGATASATRNFMVKGELDVKSGTFNTNGYLITVGP